MADLDPNEDLSTINTEAITAVCASHLHQTLWLPANDRRGRLRVTYATTRNFSDTSLPVILFCSPMFAGRMPALQVGRLAHTTGTRVICVDRPGFGGSTAVPVEARIQVWLETVPAILDRLKVQYIDGLICHSAGTLYTMNTLYHFRDRLSPKRPYVAFMAPWVHHSHSDATLMNVASMLPKGVVGGFSPLIKFIAMKVNPAVSWSGGIFSQAADLFQAAPPTTSTTDNNEEDESLAEKYGTSEAVGAATEKFSTKCFFAEDTSSASEDAKLCLKKCEKGSWGVCEDYEEYVRKLVEMEKGRGAGEGKLEVDVYFAASDIMIGKKGQRYFDECWRQKGVDEVVDYSSVELEGTNHETVITSLKKGAMRRIFEQVALSAK